MKQRKKYEKSPRIICRICGKDCSSTGFISHLKSHQISADQYADKFGEFRKNKLKTPKRPRRIPRIKCGICGQECATVGMSAHLLDSHSITTVEYVKKYGEFRSKYLVREGKIGKSKVRCLICNKAVESERALSYHVRMDHKISKKEYIAEYVFKNIPQLCKCGCGQEVGFLGSPPYRRYYITGHNSSVDNGMTGKIHSDFSKEQMREKAISRVKIQPQVNTLPERQFKEFLERNSINYIHQYETEIGSIDFYLPDHDIFVEIDGEWWHPLRKEKLTLRSVSSSVSDFRKSKMKNLFRIGASDIEKLQTLNDLEIYSRVFDFNIGYYQEIVEKGYFKAYIDAKGKKELENNAYILNKFIETYQPTFPKVETRETLPSVLESISKYKLDSILEGDTFSNHVSSTGVGYLKANFLSYWKSSYKGRPSPFQAWEDPKIMRSVVKYRIGCNESNEVFNFSYHQLVRGLSAQRYTISFFKPVVAAAIYKHFLGDLQSPTVLDPCAGFGGRMLGFKAIYPEGKYIGIEPNRETFLELQELAKNFTNIELHNCKFEDYTADNSYDIAFTSIPYYDKETYSEPVIYPSIEEWSNHFITALKKTKNLIVNIPLDLEYLFTEESNKYYLRNSPDHFNKGKGERRELILQIID